MEGTPDQSPAQPQNSHVTYGGAWERLGALLLDGLILAPVTFGINYFNIVSLKSSVLLVVITLLGTGYKPFMEFRYGATLGKMALGLKVTNLQLGEANLTEILLRNIFHIIPTLLNLIFTIVLYNDPDFQFVTGFREFTVFSQRFAGLQNISWVSGLITIIDAIVLGTDNEKRSIHDRIGGTLVIHS